MTIQTAIIFLFLIWFLWLCQDIYKRTERLAERYKEERDMFYRLYAEKVLEERKENNGN